MDGNQSHYIQKLEDLLYTVHCAEHCISVEKLSTHSPFNVPEMVFQVVFRDACVLLL